MVRPTFSLLRARALTAAQEAARHAEKLMSDPPVPCLRTFLMTGEAVRTVDPEWREPILELLRQHGDIIRSRGAFHHFLISHGYGPPCTDEQLANGIPNSDNMVWDLYEAFVAKWEALGALRPDQRF